MADAAYGLWPLVIVNTLLFMAFGLSFFRPRTHRDWRAMGGYTAFLVALFTEMYGVPLTVYLLGGWLGSRFPLLRDTHAGGHLWNDLIGWTGDPHLSPFHLASYAAIGGGFWLIAVAWRHLHAAAQADRLATTGPYAWVRHPQYDGFLLVMLGFLLQWPTIPTLMMFPVLVYVYARLARSEERDAADQFGPAWNAYTARTPAFLPHLRSRPQTVPETAHSGDSRTAWHRPTPPPLPTGASPPPSTDGSHGGGRS
ncbi:isoprenylcysteine carboxylmethyltransferase family protein [Mycolicibacterium sp. PAM1]|jgi:protein-S-isoprenylcysteine O-methyltransferase Ste14|uniref:methyltransferase family protein n=1 Tax=Mycobacteriaceae TaxID=1762 RepID=UPI0010C01987|nr:MULTISPECIES: isoprenylcysteine carboxylmethyltransferase family protein [Mycobacteriaceae]MBV5244410.1 isoprenylcysteine carboxylmethyltransferase family protein [Mycolicibacterium sp. PAM1]MCG7594823.1 isoprenylcysteine carboxylmethyltransferase family protein [Mycobacterium sp. PSTR-4-N]QZT54978.1 isoprenylcysteine carboxylmethyltransferase family protein [Mycolicibacterium austroafricanum]